MRLCNTQAGWLLAVLLALMGCEARPLLFQTDEKASINLTGIAIEDKLGVFVAGIEGAPAPASAAITARLAARLHTYEVPASTESANQGSYLLQGYAEYRPQTDAAGTALLHWQLIDAGGDVVGFFDQDETVTWRSWNGADPASLEVIATNAAPRVAGLLSDPVAGGSVATFEDPVQAILARSAPPPDGDLPKVVVATVSGAPGDGDQSLTRAMRRALGERAITVVEDDDGTALTVRGTVTVTAAGPEELIGIDWAVLAADGRELGNISQNNALPPGLLNGPWGRVAIAVAEGGADGVRELLEQLPVP